MNSGSICKRDMWTSHGMSHCSMGPWDDTHASVEGQVDILWSVPLSHGTVGWDGQFTVFLDIFKHREQSTVLFAGLLKTCCEMDWLLLSFKLRSCFVVVVVVVVVVFLVIRP